VRETNFSAFPTVLWVRGTIFNNDKEKRIMVRELRNSIFLNAMTVKKLYMVLLLSEDKSSFHTESVAQRWSTKAGLKKL